MDNPGVEPVVAKAGPPRSRPVFLIMLCLVATIYFSLISLLFLSFILFSGTITRIRSIYVPDEITRGPLLVFIFSAGLLLHLSGLAGTLLIWFRRKSGYYFLVPSCLILAIAHLILPGATIGSAVLFSALIFLFGIFFRKIQS